MDTSPRNNVRRRRSSLDSLAETDELYRILVRDLPAAVYCTDERGLITMYNDAAADLWGRRPRLGTEAWCGSYRMYRLEGTPLPLDQCPMAQVVRTGEAAAPQECIVERPSGDRRHVLVHPRPLHDTSGRVIGAVNLVVDITDRKRAEQAQRETETRFQSMADMAPVMIWVSDTTKLCTWFNKPWLEFTGRTIERELGNGWTEGVHPDDFEHCLRTYTTAFDAHESFAMEYRLRRHDGEYRWVLDHGTPRFSDDGTFLGYIGSALDVTEQKTRARHQHVLYELANSVNRAEALPELYEQALGAIIEALRADRASILLFDTDGSMRFKAWRGLSDRYRRSVEGHSPWKPDESSPSPIVVGDISGWGIEAGLKAVIEQEGIEALAFFPLMYGGRLIGKFMAYFNRPYAMTEDQLELAQAIARTLSLGIERKRTEDRLRESEARLRLALEAGRMGSWEWNIATNEVSWSTNLEVIHGLEPGTFGGTFEAFQRDIHPDDRDRVLRSIGQSLKSGADHRVQYRIVRPDGTVAWMEGQGKLVRDQTGTPVRLIGVCADITERAHADEALRESEERFRTLADNMSQFAWTATATGWIFWFNQRWLDYTGTTLEEIQGREWKTLVHPEHVDRVVRRIQWSWDTGVPWEDTFPIRGRNGRYRWFLSRAHPIRNAQGEIVRWFGTNTDITELREAQEALRESKEQMRQIADRLEVLVDERTADLVHSQDRLRALATELNLAEQRERQRLAAELHDHLQQLLVLAKLRIGQGKLLAAPIPACADVMKQVDQVLADALTYTRTLVAELSPPVLHEFGLPAALRWLGEFMRRYGLAVQVDAPQGPWMKLAEDRAVLLFQSVRELLMNASKHARSDRVWVSVEQLDDDLYIRVRDDGQGFDAAAATDRGVPTAMSSKFGLFSIRERMTALGGRFEIDSAPGQGTRATLVLPLKARDGREAREERDEPLRRDGTAPVSDLGSRTSNFDSAPPPVSPAGTPRIRVLLVDDHAMVRQGLRSVLEVYADMEVVGEASNGAEALVGVDALRPTVVVMDINMPGMNGIEATASIKSRYPHILVIGLSVNPAGENQEAMRTAGANILLTKEAAVDQLHSAIQRVVGTITPVGNA